MNLDYFIDRFSQNRGVFENLIRGVSLEQARRKPSPDKWSMLEVVNHLYDEEREDFHQRIDLVLADPTQSWPPIDPRTWVTTRGCNKRELDISLSNFIVEREKSLAWLKQLSEPNWQDTNEGPTLTIDLKEAVR